jgi:hypothetical protein
LIGEVSNWILFALVRETVIGVLTMDILDIPVSFLGDFCDWGAQVGHAVRNPSNESFNAQQFSNRQ